MPVRPSALPTPRSSKRTWSSANTTLHKNSASAGWTSSGYGRPAAIRRVGGRLPSSAGVFSASAAPWTRTGGPRSAATPRSSTGGPGHGHGRHGRWGGRSSGLCAGPTSAVPSGAASALHEARDDGEAPPAGGAVCALVESRAGEVGLAALHQRSMEFDLTQFEDQGAYTRTIAAVLALEPTAVVVNRTARGTQLVDALAAALREAGLSEVLFADRKHFDEVEGQELLAEVDLVGLQPTETSAKVPACAAFTALWRFAESSMELRLKASAARVTFRGAADVMVVDTSTAKFLELVRSARRNSRGLGTIASLFACRTPGGQRLLRQSLLQPPACRTEIEGRQAAVGVLVGSEELVLDLQRLLPSIGDVDLFAARLTSEPKTRGPQWCRAAIRTAVRLRHALASLPELAAALHGANTEASAVLDEAHVLLKHATFTKLLAELDKVLDSDSPMQLTGGFTANAALMYAVRPSVNALLDIARQTWSEALELINMLHRSYAVKYPELNVKLEYTDNRGWYLSHAAQDAPAEFMRTAKKGRTGRLVSTTRELNSENFKLRQAEREILAQTVVVLGGLYEVLREETPLLYRVSHAASSLDLLQAFASYALSLGECARPLVTDDPTAPIDIQGGRHPLVERLLLHEATRGTFEPVDFLISETCHFQVVTGANGGGKSTYLQTLAQLVILAQVGCYIPAKNATVRIVPSLFTRIGTGDNLAASASTFLVEMQDCSHILRDAAPGSLVLIDELGRGTAHADGLAICWAVCERLLEQKVRTLFATHFYEICRLQRVFPGFQNVHLESSDSTNGGGIADAGEARGRYAVHHGASLDTLLAKPHARYGVRAAEQAALPESLLERARAMAEKVDQRLARTLPYGQTRRDRRRGRTDDAAEKAAAETSAQLLALAGGATLGPGALAEVIRQLQAPWLERRRRPPGAGSAAGSVFGPARAVHSAGGQRTAHSQGSAALVARGSGAGALGFGAGRSKVGRSGGSGRGPPSEGPDGDASAPRSRRGRL